jgi:hypothetical protein
MSYIAEKYCIQPGVVIQMIRDGVVDWRLDALHDFWTFYKELEKTRTKKEIKAEIMLHYKLKNRVTYYRMMKKSRELFDE